MSKHVINLFFVLSLFSVIEFNKNLTASHTTPLQILLCIPYIYHGYHKLSKYKMKVNSFQSLHYFLINFFQTLKHCAMTFLVLKKVQEIFSN